MKEQHVQIWINPVTVSHLAGLLLVFLTVWFAMAVFAWFVFSPDYTLRQAIRTTFLLTASIAITLVLASLSAYLLR